MLRHLFGLLPIVGQNAGLISEIMAVIPETQVLIDEAWPHISELVKILDKHQGTIKKLEALSPKVQKLVNDVLPILKSQPEARPAPQVDPSNISATRNW